MLSASSIDSIITAFEKTFWLSHRNPLWSLISLLIYSFHVIGFETCALFRYILSIVKLYFSSFFKKSYKEKDYLGNKQSRD